MQSKLGVAGPEQRGLVRDIVQEYVRGLCWVMRYYYDGESSPQASGCACPMMHHLCSLPVVSADSHASVPFTEGSLFLEQVMLTAIRHWK